MPAAETREHLLQFVEPYLEEWRVAGKSEDAAFRDWAVSQVLWDYDLSSEQIEEVTAIDSARDRGIDAWFYARDDEPPTLHVIQAKNTRAKIDDVLKMRDGLESLFDSRAGLANADAKGRAADLQVDFVDGTAIEFHLVTSHFASPALVADVEAQAKPITLFERSIQTRSALHDLRDLVRELRIVRSDPIDAEFIIPPGESFEFTTATHYRTVAAAIPGADLARLFREHRTNLFRLNPRYYLSARGSVNKGMLQTLRDPNQRGDFYLYNNGITGVCEGVTVEETKEGRRVRARDFQIVNGCQTTATLHEAFEKGQGLTGLRDVTVLVRIIEAPKTFAPLIMQRTNTQNPIKAEDGRANDPRQERLKIEFSRLAPPWFYEHKRGVWVSEYPTRRDKQQFARQDGGYRHIAMKDMAQAALAFLGSPSGSIEGPRFVFQSDERYERVFPEKVQAAQMLLPYALYEAASEYVSEHGSALPGATYLRYPLVAGLSRVIHDWLGQSEIRYLTPAASLELASTLDAWAPDVMLTLFAELSRAARASTTGVRAAVRQAEWFEDPVEAAIGSLRRQLEMEATTAKRLDVDPGTLGHRSQFPLPITGP